MGSSPLDIFQDLKQIDGDLKESAQGIRQACFRRGMAVYRAIFYCSRRPVRFSQFIYFHKQRVAEEVSQLYLELSTHCNLSCRTCVRRSIEDFSHIHLSDLLLNKLLQSVNRLPGLKRIVLLGFGEALCHPRCAEILTVLGGTGRRLVLVTNGHLLNREICERLVALPVQEVYISWDDPVIKKGEAAGIRTGADLEEVREGVERLHRLKKQNAAAFPRLGMEIVAVKGNLVQIPEMIRFWQRRGVERFILTHLFPYQEEMASEILYDAPATTDLREIVSGIKGLRHRIICADWFPGSRRTCPFIERGSLFVRVDGRVAPCPELAYTHNAYYWGRHRPHYACLRGDLHNEPLDRIWQQEEFAELRRTFAGYFFPDCIHCYHPELCAHRMGPDGDCFANGVPCGECLWSRGLIRCP